MKQFESHGVTFFHNGDFSGDVHMQHERGAGFSVPGAALVAFAGRELQDAIDTVNDDNQRLLRRLEAYQERVQCLDRELENAKSDLVLTTERANDMRDMLRRWLSCEEIDDELHRRRSDDDCSTIVIETRGRLP
jgi:hypothetical protein